MTSFYPQKSLLACARKNNGHRASRPSGTSTDLPSSRVDDCGLEVGSRCFSPCRCHPMQMSPLRHHAQGDVVLRLAQGSRAPQPRTHSPAPGGSRPCCAAPGGHVPSSLVLPWVSSSSRGSSLSMTQCMWRGARPLAQSCSCRGPQGLEQLLSAEALCKPRTFCAKETRVPVPWAEGSWLLSSVT